jgi:hypothetical protein
VISIRKVSNCIVITTCEYSINRFIRSGTHNYWWRNVNTSQYIMNDENLNLRYSCSVFKFTAPLCNLKGELCCVQKCNMVLDIFVTWSSNFDVPALLCGLYLIIIITENLYMTCRHLAKEIRLFSDYKWYSHGWRDRWNVHHACLVPGCDPNVLLDQRLVSQQRNLNQREATSTKYLEKNTAVLQTVISMPDICKYGSQDTGYLLATAWSMYVYGDDNLINFQATSLSSWC